MGPSRGPFAVARASAPPPVIVPVIAAVEPAAASAATAGGRTAVATLSTRASEAAASAATAAATAEPSAASATGAGATAAVASAATAAIEPAAAATAAAREASTAPTAASVAATATPTTILAGWQRELVVARSAPTRHGTVLVGRELKGRAALAASLRARALTTVASATERGTSAAAHPAAEARGSPGASPHPWLDQGEREGLAALGALTDDRTFLVLVEGQRRSAGPAASGGSWLGFLFAIFTLLVLVVIVIVIVVGPGLGTLAAGPGGPSVLRVGLRFRVLVVVISRSVRLALRSRTSRGLLVRALFQPRQLPFLFAHRHFIPTALARPYDVPVRVEGEAQLRPALRADLGHGRSPPARTLKGEGRARATLATLRTAG